MLHKLRNSSIDPEDVVFVWQVQSQAQKSPATGSQGMQTETQQRETQQTESQPSTPGVPQRHSGSAVAQDKGGNGVSTMGPRPTLLQLPKPIQQPARPPAITTVKTFLNRMPQV